MLHFGLGRRRECAGGAEDSISGGMGSQRSSARCGRASDGMSGGGGRCVFWCGNVGARGEGGICDRDGRQCSVLGVPGPRTRGRHDGGGCATGDSLRPFLLTLALVLLCSQPLSTVLQCVRAQLVPARRCVDPSARIKSHRARGCRASAVCCACTLCVTGVCVCVDPMLFDSRNR